ncbi:hypothetical protein [Leifsonia sp. 71-9]|uniref:hypothetical protein n=1 Tax=Leifsonia sp. 71-9 TaxID=1895934 RepID=UPI000AFC8D1B|nr:hypothetical protein [Leifsonia sp. 71-9]
MSTVGAVSRPRPAPGRGSRHGLALALAHETPPAALMIAGCLAGSAAALCAAALALALLSAGYARAARRSPSAREHVVDLWAMLLVMVGMAFAGSAVRGSAAVSAVEAAGGGGTGAAPHHHAIAASGPLATGIVVVAVVGWLVARLLLARRVVRLHTVVSAAVCGGMLAAMAVM